jgi:hypothetical protein
VAAARGATTSSQNIAMRHKHACFVPLALLVASTSVARADESNAAPTPSESAPVPPAVAEREKAVAEREKAVAEREKAVAEREKGVAERERAVAEPNKPAVAEPEKKVSIGADVAMLVPVGELADDTGLAVGPLLRLGYLVGGVRIGVECEASRRAIAERASERGSSSPR